MNVCKPLTLKIFRGVVQKYFYLDTSLYLREAAGIKTRVRYQPHGAACMTSAFQFDPVNIEVDMLKMAGFVSKHVSK